MNDDHKQHLAKRLSELSRSTSISGPVHSQDRRSWCINNNQWISMHVKETDEFTSIAESLASEKIWGTKWSSNYILTKILSKMTGIKAIGVSAARLAIEALDEEFRQFDLEIVVHVPITNMIMDIDELVLGHVTFHQSSKEYRNQQVGRLTEIYQKYPPEEQEKFKIEDAAKVLLRPMSYETSASFRTVAEPELGMERALTEIRRTLEVLTISCARKFPHQIEGDIQVSIAGEVPATGPSIVYWQGGYPTAHQENYASSVPLQIGDGFLPALEALGITPLFRLLQRPPRQLSDIENALLRAIHWFAVSQGQLEPENRLLNLTTAFECLLTYGEQQSITSKVSEGTAVLLAEDRNYDDFKWIKDCMRSMYADRSNVSHGGYRVMALSQMQIFRKLACNLIFKVWDMHSLIQTRSDLQEFIERKRYAGMGSDRTR